MNADKVVVVIDFQAFKSPNNEFIVKEVASFNGSQSLHCVFLPPCEFHELIIDCQRQVSWLSNKHHHLNWSDGYAPLDKLQELLGVAVRGAEQIYVKGREKAEFIENCLRQQQLLHYPMVCEFAEQPALTARSPHCPFHRHSKTFCALTNAHYLYTAIAKKN